MKFVVDHGWVRGTKCAFLLCLKVWVYFTARHGINMEQTENRLWPPVCSLSRLICSKFSSLKKLDVKDTELFTPGKFHHLARGS